MIKQLIGLFLLLMIGAGIGIGGYILYSSRFSEKSKGTEVLENTTYSPPYTLSSQQALKKNIIITIPEKSEKVEEVKLEIEFDEFVAKPSLIEFRYSIGKYLSNVRADDTKIYVKDNGYVVIFDRFEDKILEQCGSNMNGNCEAEFELKLQSYLHYSLSFNIHPKIYSKSVVVVESRENVNSLKVKFDE